MIITNEKDGRKLVYEVDEYGVHQLDERPFAYDAKYCSTYDTEQYRHGEDVLSAARLGFAIAAHGKPITTILDFGCGNFAFLERAKKIIPLCFGYDVSGLEAPPLIVGTNKYTDYYEVVTFHDSLEHTKNPADVIKMLDCDTIIISLPNCQFTKNGSDWFFNEYYHLKPDEHLHHFDQESLDNFMFACGWQCIAVSNHEDIVRKRGNWNILSMAFKKL